VLMVKLREMFNDTDHFHGRLVEKKMIVGEQVVDITTIEQTNDGVFVSGMTNLKKGDPIEIIFDEKENVLYSDRNRSTFTAYAEGDDPGAMRTWRGTMNINLQDKTVGTHFLTAHPPQGEPVTVSFYVAESFAPFQVPEDTIRYINRSPFIPTPTPLIVEKEVQVTVMRTIVVEVTPAYDVVLLAQNESAEVQREIMQRYVWNLEMWSIGLLLAGIMTFEGGRYLVSVVRRARKL
jgi:hypothetical protein